MSLMEQEAANLDNLFSLMYLWFVESLHLSSLEKNKSCISSPQVATRRGLDSFLALFNHLSVQFLSLSSCFSISDSVLVIHPLVSYCSSIVQGAPICIFLFLWRRRTWKKKKEKNLKILQRSGSVWTTFLHVWSDASTEAANMQHNLQQGPRAPDTKPSPKPRYD